VDTPGRGEVAPKYASLGITHFVLSDTPYLREIKRQGDQLLTLTRRQACQPHWDWSRWRLLRWGARGVGAAADVEKALA
jgi:hypothetical protein